MLPFKVDYTDGFKNYKFIYPEGIDNKKMHKYKEFHIKNIGNSDINQLDICAIFKNHNILVDYNGLDAVIENGFVNYNLCYDRKIMKSDIHPDYKKTTIKCVCGNEIETGSVMENITVEICNNCHPFYTGQQKILDSEGRVERFNKRYGNK